MPLKTLAPCINYNRIMRLLLILLFSTQVLASDNYKLSEGRKVFIGPSFKIWCSLTKKGEAKVGGKDKLSKGNLVLFPKSNGTGHLPAVVGKDFGKKEEINEFFISIKEVCQEDLKVIQAHVEENLKTWIGSKVGMISLRIYDEVLWEYYQERFKKDKMKNACEIRNAYNVKKAWVLTYPELNKSCL